MFRGCSTQCLYEIPAVLLLFVGQTHEVPPNDYVFLDVVNVFYPVGPGLPFFECDLVF